MHKILDITHPAHTFVSHIPDKVKYLMEFYDVFSGFKPVIFYTQNKEPKNEAFNIFVVELTPRTKLEPEFREALCKYYVDNIWTEQFTETFECYEFSYDGQDYLIRDYELDREKTHSSGFITIKKVESKK